MANHNPQLTIVVSAIEPKLLINMLQLTLTGGPAGWTINNTLTRCTGQELIRTYHGYLCDRAETVDKNIACNVYRGTCEME